MGKRRILVLVVCCVCTILPAASTEDVSALPPAVRLSLQQLEVTDHLLDQVASQVWPGWTEYRTVPFLFHYPNGLQVLAGYDSPPAEFQVVSGVYCRGMRVFKNESRMTDAQMIGPLLVYGGFTSLIGGVSCVEIFFESRHSPKASSGEKSTEKTILAFIHELFHCFQTTQIQRTSGGELYDPSVDYSYYSTIEAMALERALRTSDPASATDYVKDFLAARRKKRQCMPVAEGRGESENELGEGTATYAELKTLQILQQGYSTLLKTTEDSEYSGFTNPGNLIEEYYDRLHAVSADLLATHDRCYMYGGAQAMLLDRFVPDWQIRFSKSATFLDAELGRKITLSKADLKRSAKRFREIYPTAGLRQRCRSAVAEMERAIRTVQTRQGYTYTIDFRMVDYFPGPAPGKPTYSQKTTLFYPKGVGDVRAGRIELAGGDIPAECPALTRLVMTNTQPVAVGKSYSIEFQRVDEHDIYQDARIQTPLFVLKAPRIRIVEETRSVTFILLSR